MLRRIDKPVVFVAALLPAAWEAWAFFNGGLTANPIEGMIRFNGDWALRFLILTLAITPLHHLTHWPVWMRLRRMLGLFAFFYAVLHVAGYVGLDQFFDWHAIWGDIAKRTFITVGMVVFVALIPLAVTSTNGMIKRLGGPRWRKLHRLVYPAAVLGVVHYFMMVKAIPTAPFSLSF